jgi:hypothetical protein
VKTDKRLLIAAAVVCSISAAPAFAKTAKECTAEWRADKAGMQARGVTEKAYVERCRSGAEPTAATPAAKPAETTSPPCQSRRQPPDLKLQKTASRNGALIRPVCRPGRD